MAEFESKPLWKRLPPRPVSAAEVAAALPDPETVGHTAVYAAFYRDEYDANGTEFDHLLVETENNYLDLAYDGDPNEWYVAVRKRKGEVSTPNGEFGYFSGREAAEALSFTDAEVHSHEEPTGVCLWDIAEGRDGRGRMVRRKDTNVPLGDDRVAEIRERLLVESGLRNGGITAHEAAGRLFSAREPTVSAVENALAHLADALEPLVEAVVEAAKALTDAFSDIVDLSELEPETAGAVAQAWHETDADVTSPPAHPNARCSTVPMYASHVEFGDLRGEVGRVPDEPEYANISDVSVTVETGLVTEAAETAMREFAEQAERVAKRRGVRR